MKQIEFNRQYKLGTTLPSGQSVPHLYSDMWDVEKTKGPERMVIAPARRQTELMVDLLSEVPEPFGILYVLLVSRCGNQPARYQSPYPTDRAETSSFVKEYGEYLEHDGRHHLWLMSLSSDGLLVYDQHNVIYAYGPLGHYKAILKVRGFSQGAVRFPVPHTHHYNAVFDVSEQNIMGRWGWKQFPLQPGDDT